MKDNAQLVQPAKPQQQMQNQVLDLTSVKVLEDPIAVAVNTDQLQRPSSSYGVRPEERLENNDSDKEFAEEEEEEKDDFFVEVESSYGSRSSSQQNDLQNDLEQNVENSARVTINNVESNPSACNLGELNNMSSTSELTDITNTSYSPNSPDAPNNSTRGPSPRTASENSQVPSPQNIQSPLGVAVVAKQIFMTNNN